MALPFHQVDFVGVHRFLVAEQGNDDTQSDGCLRRRIHDHKNSENLSVYGEKLFGESHQVDVHGVQNEFDGHQDDHDVSAREHSDGSNGKKSRAQKKVMSCSDWEHECFSAKSLFWP